MTAKNVIFKNANWKVVRKQDYIEIQNLNHAIPTSTANGAVLGSSGKIRYWNPSTVPDYIKDIVRTAFGK